MKFALAAIFLVSASAGAAAHPCDQDAIERATPLLTLQYDSGDDEAVNLAIDDTVKTLAPVRALKGSGKFDVLEVWGHIYKADYRMHVIYAQGDDSCLLMGQEILEASDPY
jgi:hypothetical protein